MASTKIKIYVGCALTHADDKFRSGVEKLKSALRDEGYEVVDFLWVLNENPTPGEVFEHDIMQCIRSCDAFVAICDHPSLGLGYELAEAANLKKPILELAQKNSKVSKLILGAAERLPNVHFKRYKDIEIDVVPLVNGWLKTENFKT